MYTPVDTAAVIQVDDVTSLSADGKSTTAQKVRLLFSWYLCNFSDYHYNQN